MIPHGLEVAGVGEGDNTRQEPAEEGGGFRKRVQRAIVARSGTAGYHRDAKCTEKSWMDSLDGSGYRGLQFGHAQQKSLDGRVRLGPRAPGSAEH